MLARRPVHALGCIINVPCRQCTSSPSEQRHNCCVTVRVAQFKVRARRSACSLFEYLFLLVHPAVRNNGGVTCCVELFDVQVYKARNKVTKDVVALKKIRVHSENYGVRLVLVLVRTITVNINVILVLCCLVRGLLYFCTTLCSRRIIMKQQPENFPSVIVQDPGDNDIQAEGGKSIDFHIALIVGDSTVFV